MTRTEVRSPAGLHSGDHLLWTFDDDAALGTAVATFFADGVHADQLFFIGDAERIALADRVPGYRELHRSGRLRVEDSSIYGDDGVDAQAMIASLRAAADDAAARGLRSLRVVGDATPLLLDVDGCNDFIAYERAADDLVDHAAITALCTADTRRVSARAIAGLATVHPSHGDHLEEPPFRMYSDGPRLVVTGEIDIDAADCFVAALRGVALTDHDVVLDLTGLEFLDVRSSQHLFAWTRAMAARGLTVRFDGVPPRFRRYWSLMGLSA